MKRYERMSKEEILYELSRLDTNVGCSTLLNYLTAEIKMKKVHRYELIKLPEDVEKFRCEWKEYCNHKTDCSRCKYDSAVRGSAGCFANYLKEEIEVEE